VLVLDEVAWETPWPMRRIAVFAGCALVLLGIAGGGLAAGMHHAGTNTAGRVQACNQPIFCYTVSRKSRAAPFEVTVTLVPGRLPIGFKAWGVWGVDFLTPHRGSMETLKDGVFGQAVTVSFPYAYVGTWSVWMIIGYEVRSEWTYVSKNVPITVTSGTTTTTPTSTTTPTTSPTPTSSGARIGFSEDATKYADDGGDKLFTEMNKLGPTMNRVTVLWNADQPTVIQDQAFLDRMIPVARAHKIEVVFAIYPSKPSQAPTTQGAADAFCSYAVQVMRRYPYVRKVIIGNEPNQPRFWQPIWNGSTPASPAAMEVVLASCYDQLKAFDSSLDVIGVGLSPRGNDDSSASSNASVSPVRWIAALGKAYRASGRTRPLFDEFSWHCYPNVNTDSVETGYAWPNAGCVNSARIKLALYDAFHGTGQPQLAAYSPATNGTDLFGTTSKQFIDEAGWQVDTTGLPGYTGSENVPVIAEAQQAIDYEKLVHLANCEPTLSAFNTFHMIDEQDRTGFQSGVLRLDGSERPSATDATNSVQHAMAADGGACKGGVWQTLGSFLYSNSAVAPLYKSFPYQDPQPLVSKTISGGGLYVALQAGEGFTYKVTFKSGTKTRAASGSAPRTTATVKVPTGFGTGTATIVLTAETNPQRTSTVTLNLGSGKTVVTP
jgi:hypothetical protein